MLESKVSKRTFDEPVVSVWNREHLETEANLAMKMIVNWGMVAATPGEEDSAGRAKFQPLTPQELVTRACETASLFMEECRARDWTHIAPSVKVAEERDNTTKTG